MIEINLLRYALAAAETGSFSRAANQFRIKQSTLSKRIHYLESRLGLILFERSPRGVLPTYSGNWFLKQAKQIVNDVDTLASASGALAKGDAGQLRLGFCGSLTTGDLSAVLASFRGAFPAVEIEAREGGRTSLLNKLDSDELDVAVLAGRPERTGMRSLCFWREPLTIILSVDDPLADRMPLFWSDLRGRGFIVTANDPGPDIAAMIMCRLAEPGHRPSIVAQEVSRENLAQLGSVSRLPVMAGAAIGVVSMSALRFYREIHDAAGPTALDQGVHWRVTNTSPTLSRFLQHLSRRYARPLPTQ